MQFIKGINDFELLMVHVILFFSRWNNFNKNPTALKKNPNWVHKFEFMVDFQ